jgi:hypothetical protein
MQTNQEGQVAICFRFDRALARRADGRGGALAAQLEQRVDLAAAPVARATERGGAALVTAHNNKYAQQKNAPPKRGKLKALTNGTDTRPRDRAQY